MAALYSEWLLVCIFLRPKGGPGPMLSFSKCILISFAITVFSINAPAGEQNSVDLSYQVSSKSRCQRGDICHIHAAAYLFEAMCFRRTGKRVNLSRAYLYYLHLLGTLDERQIYFDDNKRTFTTGDIGFSKNTLKRLLDGDAITESEEVDVEAFFNHLGPEFAPMAYYVLPAVLGGAALEYTFGLATRYALGESCGSIFRILGGGVLGATVGVVAHQASFPATALANLNKEKLHGVARTAFGGARPRTKDPTIKQCLKKPIRIVMGGGGKTSITKRLDAGIPVLCSGVWDNSTRTIHPTGKSLPHVAIVLGYRNTKAGTQILVKNDWGGEPSWWNLKSCLYTVALE